MVKQTDQASLRAVNLPALPSKKLSPALLLIRWNSLSVVLTLQNNTVLNSFFPCLVTAKLFKITAIYGLCIKVSRNEI